MTSPTVHVKFVDDTQGMNSSKDPKDKATQEAATYTSEWSKTNNMKLNGAKTKDMIFSFMKKEPEFEPIVIDGRELERVKEETILGLTIQDDLKWNSHVEKIIKKANKRLFLLTLLKRSGVDQNDLVEMYTSITRPILEYASPVFHAALPKYLQRDIESVQKRALVTIGGLESYEDNLRKFELDSLSDRRTVCCRTLFKEMSKSDHKLNHLIPKPKPRRSSRTDAALIDPPKFRTNRYRDTFVPYALLHFQ